MNAKSQEFTNDNGSMLTAWILESKPSEAQIKFVDSVFLVCERNYERGGDNITECFTPQEILEEFTTLKEVKEYCGDMVEKALNAREGTDSDPQLLVYEMHQGWKWRLDEIGR